jgi:hypothetical protein
MPGTASAATAASPFSHDRFLVRRKVLAFLAPKFHFYDPEGRVIAFTRQAPLRLREDTRIYSDESRTRELLRIKARQIIDFSAVYCVEDAATGQRIGTLKRRGWKSLLKDEWILMDALDHEFGRIKEDSRALAVVRRFLTNLVPQKFVFYVDEREAGFARQHFNPFVLKMDVDLTPDTGRRLDRRLVPPPSSCSWPSRDASGEFPVSCPFRLAGV